MTGSAVSMGRIFLLVLTFLIGTVPLAEAGVRSLKEIREEGLVMQQWDASCGAAALATVLTYALGHPVSERRAVSGLLKQTEPVKVRYRGGFSLLDMKRYVNTLGFRAVGMKGLSYEQLLDLQSPIVPIKLGGYNHYVVVKGENERGRLLVGDPAFGNISYSRKKFERIWMNRMAFTVSTQDDAE
jgi:predicted double-glycine peptidase